MTQPTSSSSACRPDSSGADWFRCSHGTIGCPRVHDLLTPHCIECAAGVSCGWDHDPPALERKMTLEEYDELVRSVR